VQQKVNESIPSCDDLASKGHNHRMLLTFPMALNPFVTMQEKRFFHVIPSCYYAKLNLLICFSIAMLHAVSDESCFFKLQHPFKSSFWSAFSYPIDEGSSFKLDHHDKSSFSSAFNWPIDEGRFST
jgi:hypothetical protein